MTFSTTSYVHSLGENEERGPGREKSIQSYSHGLRALRIHQGGAKPFQSFNYDIMTFRDNLYLIHVRLQTLPYLIAH
eukprot:scaffold288652_cov31-Prasinocladus_malaysianus.AAC.1